MCFILVSEGLTVRWPWASCSARPGEQKWVLAWRLAHFCGGKNVPPVRALLEGRPQALPWEMERPLQRGVHRMDSSLPGTCPGGLDLVEG